MSPALRSPRDRPGHGQLRHRSGGCGVRRGACLGPFLGQLTDRFGRKKLFLMTLGVYTVATVLTAFSMNADLVLLLPVPDRRRHRREYAAINSAIDELIPAKYRGRVDVAINGSFWVGATAGALLTIPLLDPTWSTEWGWRLASDSARSWRSGSWSPPERPRRAPLAVHPRPRGGERADRLRDRGARRAETGKRLPRGRRDHHHPAAARPSASRDRPDRVHALPEAHDPLLLAVRRPGVPLQRLLLHLRRHPRHVHGRDAAGWYIAVFAASNFAGALLLGPLFDTSAGSR